MTRFLPLFISLTFGQSISLVTLDSRVESSFRGLSVVNQKVVWVSGTGGTVLRTIDGGKNWENISVPNMEKIDFRDVEGFNKNTAIVMGIASPARFYKTTDGGQNWKLVYFDDREGVFFDGMSFWNKNDGIAFSDPVDGQHLLIRTTDGGDTWHTTLHGERVYNITAADSIVLVASRSGLWKTVTDNPLDVAKPWAKYNPAKQTIMIGSTGMYRMDELFSDPVLGVVYDTRPFYASTATIWIGSWDGLARAMDPHGMNWQIYRANFDADKVYAYPNPFSPYEHNQVGGTGYVHIHADVKISFIVKMNIFNFAMESVYSKNFDRRQATTGSLKWDGKDSNGRVVDNGTYFIRLEYDQKIKWMKLIVIK